MTDHHATDTRPTREPFDPDDLIRRGDVIDLCHRAIQIERAKSRHEYSAEHEEALMGLLDALTGWCSADIAIQAVHPPTGGGPDGVLNWYFLRNDVSTERREEIIRAFFGGRKPRRLQVKANLIRLLARGNTVVVNAEVHGSLRVFGQATIIDTKLDADA